VGRRVKIIIGVALVVLGVFATVAGAALVVLVGPDGSVGISTRFIGQGYAVTLPQLDVPRLPDGQHVTFHIALEPGSSPMFLGIGPSPAVDAYLRGVPIDVVDQLDRPGAAGTSSVPGTTAPAPPAGQPFWVITATGAGPSLDWTARPGDWTLVVMRAQPQRTVNVAASGSVTIPILGPLGFVVLAIALAVLGFGVWITVREARARAS
jgi:hypothetical protein